MEDDLGILGKPAAAPTSPARPPAGPPKSPWQRGYESYIDPSSYRPPSETLSGDTAPTPTTPFSARDPSSWGPALERGYEQHVAPVGQKILGQALTGGLAPDYAKPVGQALFPGTIPQAGRDIAMLTMPETWGWKATLPIMVGGSAALGELTGRSPVKEAAAGAGQWTLTKPIAGGLGSIGSSLRTYGEKRALQEGMENVGTLIKKNLPFQTPDLKVPNDFIRTFGRGQYSEGLDLARDNLSTVKKTISQHPNVRMETFPVQVPLPEDPAMIPKGAVIRGDTMFVNKSFDEADKAISDLHQLGYDSRTGLPRGGVNPDRARQLAYGNRDRVIRRLEMKAPGHGIKYSVARKGNDAAHVLSDIFSKPGRGLWENDVLQQRPFVEALRSREGVHLNRSFKPDVVESMERAVRHGFPGEAYDVPSEAGGLEHMRLHPGLHGGVPVPIPSVHYSPGQAAKIVGTEYPWWMKLETPLRAAGKEIGGAPFRYLTAPDDTTGNPGPTSSAGGFGLSSLLGEGTAFAEEPPQEKPKALPAIQDLQNREISPTPGGAARAGEITKGLVPGRAPVDVSRDLERGRLSSDEVKKLLLRSGSSDPGAMVAGIPLTDLMGAAETGSPQEKQYLIPLIQQRMMQELPKLGNKTTQANLAQRFQRLQRSAGYTSQTSAP